MANLQDVTIGTNKELVKFPLGCESLRSFNGDQIVGDLSLVARQLSAATPDGIALLELPDFTLWRCVDEPIEIVMHRPSLARALGRSCSDHCALDIRYFRKYR